MNQDKKPVEQAQKKKSKIDFVVILCILGIIFFTLVAVLPPLLRVLLEDRVEDIVTPPPIGTPPAPTEPTSGTLVCRKEESTADVRTNSTETYYFTDSMVTRIENTEIKELTETSSVTKENLALSCNESAASAQDIEGIEIYCNNVDTNQVTKTQTIDYANLDLYMLEHMSSGLVLEFNTAPTLDAVRTQKETNGYVCNQE